MTQQPLVLLVQLTLFCSRTCLETKYTWRHLQVNCTSLFASSFCNASRNWRYLLFSSGGFFGVYFVPISDESLSSESWSKEFGFRNINVIIRLDLSRFKIEIFVVTYQHCTKIMHYYNHLSSPETCNPLKIALKTWIEP